LAALRRGARAALTVVSRSTALVSVKPFVTAGKMEPLMRVSSILSTKELRCCSRHTRAGN